MELNINGKTYPVEVAPETPLLWVLRDHLGLTGTKFGCGMGLCGSCTVHMGGNQLRSCVMPVSAVGSQPITTIEGLGDHPVKAAWIAEQVPQCGYCQSGQLMAASAYLATNPRPTLAEVKENVTNLCRCGTYNRIHKAILRAAQQIPASAVPEAPPAPEESP